MAASTIVHTLVLLVMGSSRRHPQRRPGRRGFYRPCPAASRFYRPARLASRPPPAIRTFSHWGIVKAFQLPANVQGRGDSMKPLLLAGSLCGALLQPMTLLAQDLTITNARIIAAGGEVIEQGAIVVRGGVIESVTAGDAATPVGEVVDAGGMTAMPGFID